MAESAHVERRRSCDLDDSHDRLVLVREVVALLNSGGGTIVIGVKKNGDVVGIPVRMAARLELRTIEEIVNGYIRPDQVELVVNVAETENDHRLVEIGVRGVPDPPVVVAQAGTHTDSAGRQQEVFGAQSVFVRRNNRTELARREDHLRWRAEAIDNVRREIRERLTLVVDAPMEAKVRIVTKDEVRDEPSYFLSRSTELFRLQADQLLSSQDLVYLWLHRATLTFDDEASELVVQSALRKRATLYLWLTVLPLATDQIRRFLFRALTMKDRDKSDAARAMLLVSALYLEADDYVKLAAALAQSNYVHMREAVETLPDIEHARAQLKGERLIGRGQEQLVQEPDLGLFAQVDELLGRGGTPSRRVPSLGLELLCRKLDRRSL